MRYPIYVFAVLLMFSHSNRLCHADVIGVLVPAYANPAFSPDGPVMWTSLVSTAEDTDRNFAIRAILNPDTGPGRDASIQQERFNQYFGQTGNGLASRFRSAGGQTLGYVSTLRGERSLADVTADIDVYMSGIYATNIDGIFLDDFFDAAGDIPYYESIFSHIQSNYSNALLVGNTGNVGDMFSGLNSLSEAEANSLISPLDTLVSHEMTLAQYISNYSELTHAARFPVSKFAHLVHDAGTWDPNVLSLALTRDAGWLYFTPDSGDNPWDNFDSTFWNSFTGSVNAVPEPASGGLVLFAGISLLGLRRFRPSGRTMR